MKQLSALFIAAGLIFLFAGCKSYDSDFVEKTPEQLAAMEQNDKKAHKMFLDGEYEAAEKLLRELVRERTLNLLLYQQELISLLTIRNQHEEALEFMLEQHKEWEVLLSPAFKEKAENLWHGNDNVYLASEYERTFLYLLMALSYIDQSRFDDALRCVKYGFSVSSLKNLHHNRKGSSNSASENWNKFPILYYVGYLAAARSGNMDLAEVFFRKMLEGVQTHGFHQKAGKKSSYDHLRNVDVNVLLLVWNGEPPTVAHDLEEDKKVIVKNKNAWDMISVSVDGEPPLFFPPHLGSLDLFATTSSYVSKEDVINWQNHVNDPEISYPFCRILPGNISILPLKLAPGKHKIFLSGHNRSDRGTMKVCEIKVSETGFDVIHLPLLHYPGNISEIRRKHWKAEWESVIEKSNEDRLKTEIEQ